MITQETGIGRLVNKHTKRPNLIGKKAIQVKDTWKALVRDGEKRALLKRYKAELQDDPEEDKVRI